MFKKNPNRPPINISLKRTSQGYRLLQNEAFQLFTTKKIIRSIYRPDLMQMSAQNIQGAGNSGGLASGTIIQPPSHVTIPSVTSWFKEDQIHQIEKEIFSQYFRPEVNTEVFSFSVKNANLYKYYRNSMIFMWRENAKKYLSPSLCRKNLLGDVSSIMRIHAFLQNWGLINFPTREHIKGILVDKPQNLECYVCEISNSKAYYVAQIEDVLFQICEDCFNNDFYPQSIKKAQFRRILYDNHWNNQKQLDKSQIIRMLQIVTGIPNGAPKDKDRDMWSVIQKEFPQISKQKIMKTFLKIPLTVEMNSNIFQNNQDCINKLSEQLKRQLAEVQQPSIFEDFENPILGSIAYMYYMVNKYDKKMSQSVLQQIKQQQQTLKIQDQYNQQQQQLQYYKSILQSTQQHAKTLAVDQQNKIKDLVKMLIQVSLSKLELKSLFISEYEKLITSQKYSSLNLIKNNLAQSLKCNLKYLEDSQNLELVNKEDNQEENNHIQQNLQANNQNNQINHINQSLQANKQPIWDDNDLDL